MVVHPQRCFGYAVMGFMFCRLWKLSDHQKQLAATSHTDLCVDVTLLVVWGAVECEWSLVSVGCLDFFSRSDQMVYAVWFRTGLFKTWSLHIVVLWFTTPYSMIGGCQVLDKLTVMILIVDEDGSKMFLQNIHIHLSHFKCRTHKTTIEFAFSFANLMICKDSSYVFLLISLILDVFC
jgi:hypothetical protein